MLWQTSMHLCRAANIEYHSLLWFHQQLENHPASTPEWLTSNSESSQQSAGKNPKPKPNEQTNHKTNNQTTNQPNKSPKHLYIRAAIIVIPFFSFVSVPILLLVNHSSGDAVGRTNLVLSREKHCETNVHYGCITAPNKEVESKGSQEKQCLNTVLPGVI